MTNEFLGRMEAHIKKLEGNLTHVKRVHLLCKLIAEKENMEYDDDILAFAAYFHDIAAYPYLTFTPPTADFDHALESSKMMPELAKEYGYNDTQTEMVDYLGYMAAARDFSRFPNDFNKVLATLKRRKAQFLPIIDLPYAKELVAPRVEELEHFINRFEEECYGIF